MPDTNRKNIWEHWPILVLLVIVFVILATALVCFQVKETEHVVVLRWKNPQPARNTEPGLRVHWPYPIETLWRHDNRLHVFTGSRGVMEEVLTSDKRNVIVTVFITWRVSYDKADPEGTVIRYMKRVGNKKTAEEKLTGLIRSSRLKVFGKYPFSALINTDPAKIKIAAIEAALLADISSQAKKDFAIEVQRVGIAHVGLPQKATAKVFERMRANRKIESDQIIAEGEAKAKKIRAEADEKRDQIIATAESLATGIRAEGDEEATKSYKDFKKNPELAIFLMQLDALKKMLSKETILVLDTSTPPLNLLTAEALDKLKNDRINKKTDTDKKPAKK